MRQALLAVALVLFAALATGIHPGAVSGATPTPTPAVIPTPSPTATAPAPPVPPILCGAGCGPPPCNFREAAPAQHVTFPGLYRTRQGVAIRLWHIATTPSLSAMSVYGDVIAWGVPSYSDPGARTSHPPRLYISNLTHFEPRLVSQTNTCGTGFDDIHLSANWLVWMQHVSTNEGRGLQLNRIWALNIHSGRRILVNFRSKPSQGVGDFDPLSLEGDTVTWAQITIYGHRQWATYSIMRRNLATWGMTYPVSTTMRLVNGRFPLSPSVVGISQPDVAGNVLTWVRTRWTGTRSLTDVMMTNLRTRKTAELQPADGMNPATNGHKVVWVAQTSDSPGLVLKRFDVRTGRTAVLSTRLDNLLPSGPRLSANVLAWRTRSIALSGASSVYRIVARDLRTGRQYRLAGGSDPSMRQPFTLLTGPGSGWQNRVVWQQTMANARGRVQVYLAVADVP